MIRPQQRQRKEHQAMMSKLRPGDHVVTISRLHGVVSEVNEQERTVTLDCEGIYLTFDLVAVQRVISPAKSNVQTDAKAASKKDDAKDVSTKQDQQAEAPQKGADNTKTTEEAADSTDKDADKDSAK